MERNYHLIVPSEDYGSELEHVARSNDGIFDPDAESNFTAEVVCSLSFSLICAVSAVTQILMQYQALKTEKITLVTPKAVYKNITFEQAQIILSKIDDDQVN